TVGPAVSPDGKRIAVAAWQRAENQPSRLQVIVYSNSGKEEWRSTNFEWSYSHKAKGLGMSSVFWLTKDHLLVWAEDLYSPANGTALVDRGKDRLIHLEGIYPIHTLSSPVRPDGKGFLACSAGGGELPSRDEGFPWAFFERWDRDTAILSGPTMTLRADTRAGKLTRD